MSDKKRTYSGGHGEKGKQKKQDDKIWGRRYINGIVEMGGKSRRQYIK